MFEISKRFEFSAAHQLDHLPVDHQCARLHGHNYVVVIVLRAESLNADGFVIDFGDLAPFRDLIDTRLDHRNLNDVLQCRTTAENIAEWLYWQAMHMWPGLVHEVRVSETPKTWATYRPTPLHATR